VSRVCPHCGSDVPRRALACPECGSDRETGWADEETISNAEFPSFSEEDYEDVVRDLPGASPPRRSPREIALVAIVLVTLIAVILVYVL
jgi:uncharacterized membrane protein YvbJ